jgi:hypothetical protein
MILNLPLPIKINYFSPFYISSNETLFEFEYNSEEKTDIICVLKPYSNEAIFGKLDFFTNLNSKKMKFILTLLYTLKHFFSMGKII